MAKVLRRDRLDFTKDCKNSVRYDSPDPINAITNAVYVNKKCITGDIPPHVYVIVEVDE